MKKGIDKHQVFQHDSAEDDDVEILEVVGIRDETPGDLSNGVPTDLSRAEEEPEEIILSLDEETAPRAEAPAAPTVRGVVPGRASEVVEQFGETDLSRRLRADYDNLRKRIDRERRDFELHANSNLVAGLLPVLDNMERAMAAQGQPGGEEALREGLVLIYRQLSEALRREGLRAIETVGTSFDPQLHEAVATDVLSPKPANTIVAELQRGYVFQERVLRPAMVKVSLNRVDLESGRTDRTDGEPR